MAGSIQMNPGRGRSVDLVSFSSSSSSPRFASSLQDVHGADVGMEKDNSAD